MNAVGSAAIGIALLSHTNVGKTTLARTLLRRDIGAVMDRAHVTEVAEAHVLMRTPQGDELTLWDTPGFGDSVRLLRRLERSGQPIGWFLSQVWDRFADRPFWCSQQAMRAARDSADVVLYVVNATEDPAAAGYVDPELQIIDWIQKPAIVLLNQLGTRADPARDRELAERWQALLAGREATVVRRVLSFDAFARCWLQEHLLLAAIEECVEPPLHHGFVRLVDAWRDRDRKILQQSAALIASQLAATARDEERAASASLPDKARRWLLQGTESGNAAELDAQHAMFERLDRAVRESTAALVQLHGLTGSASDEIVQRLGGEFAHDRAPDADRAGIIGGLVTGAVSGLAADLAAGGLTFGAGAVLGGLAGALGARKLTQRYNEERGLEGSTVRWADEFLEARLAAALVRYLAVAHFGRGRGDFMASDPTPRWRDSVTSVMQSLRLARDGLWGELRIAGAPVDRIERVVEDLLWAVLSDLYPDAAGRFERDDRALERR